MTIGDLFWTPYNFAHFYARPFRETATTAEQTRQAETEAGVTWSLRGSGCLVTLLEALQVLLILMIILLIWTLGTKLDSQLGPLQYQKDIFPTQSFRDQDLNPNLMYNRITVVFSGEISLRGEKRPKKADGQIIKGNVYLDGHPICDDGWTREDATVACR